MVPVGFTAYQAWRQSLARSQEGKDVKVGSPEWEELPIAEREAWEAAEEAVREMYTQDGS